MTKKFNFLLLFLLNFISSLYAFSQQNNSFKFLKTIEIGITIDDLAAAGIDATSISREEISNKIIEALSYHKVPEAYGFVNGILIQDAKLKSKILNDWKKSGHLLGNHTYSHSNLAKVDSEYFIQDIEKNESTLIDHASNFEELKVFRFPYLMEGSNQEKRYAIRSYFSERKYKIAQVSIDSGDWKYNEAFIRCKDAKNTATEKEIIDKYILNVSSVLKYQDKLSKLIYGINRKTPHVLLLHYNALNAFALKDLLEQLKKMNVKFIPSPIAINDQIFQMDPAVYMNEGIPFYEQVRRSLKLKYEEPLPENHSNWLKNLCK
jgi:peptidoglycan/xylan/chitin deacetylase (PgdA/CDA1 family)